MARKIGVFSSKGGVGKTTTVIHLARALQQLGKNIVVIDADFRMPNISAYFGVQVPITLHNVLRGEKHITQAIYTNEKLNIVFGSIHIKDINVEPSNFANILYSLDGLFDIIIVDTGQDFSKIISGIDECLIVTTADLMSITDSLKTIRLIEYYGKPVKGVIVNKLNQYSIPLENIFTLLGRPIIGVIPEDQVIQKALQARTTVTEIMPNSEVTMSFKRIAGGVIETEAKQNKLHNFFRVLGLK